MAGLPASFPQIVRAGIDASLDELHTAMPAEVVAYDPITNTAFVKPCVKHALYTADNGRAFEEYPEIPFVPVVFPRAGGKVLRLPVSAGDTVLLVFSESSMAEWRSSGQVSEQEDARRHSLGWPVAIPGLFADKNPMSPLDAVEVAAGAAIFGVDGSATLQMLIGGTLPGIRFGKLAISPIALATPMLAFVTLISAATTAGGTANTSTASALSALQSYIAAVASAAGVAGNAGVVSAASAATTAVTTATTNSTASATAATAAAAGATTAGTAVPSTIVKSL